MNVPRPIDSGRESVENGRTRVVGSSAFKRRQQHPLENGRLTGSTRDGRLAVREAQLPAAAVPLETEHEESRRETTVPAFRMIVVAVAATLCTGATVLAADYRPSAPLDVSAGLSLAGCIAGASADFTSAYSGAEVEPQVAVNPLNPLEMIGASQQDRWPDGGARGLTSWISHDGGKSWSKLPDVPWSACQGGPARFGRVTDPWVSYDAAGNAYFIGQPIDSADLGLSAVSITTFDRQTGAWRAPQILIEDVGTRGVFNDKISVTGDPTRPGYASATWLRGDYPNGGRQSQNADLHSFAFRGLPMISRTTDGGRTWSKAEPIRQSNAYFQGNQIAVLPDGTLLNTAAILFRGSGVQPNTNGVFMAVMRSTDAGRTWSAPIKVAPLQTIETYNPDDGSPLRVGDYLPDIAVDMKSGATYVVWSDAQGGAVNHVVLSRSTDGGRHWSSPVPVGNPAVESFNHAVTVTDSGSVAVLYYDIRNNTSADGLPTDVWLTHSDDGGHTFGAESHLYGPFDFTIAPESAERGPFIGDYVGLENTTADDLIAFYAVAVARNDADIISQLATK